MLNNEINLTFNYQTVLYENIKSGEHKRVDTKKGHIARLSLPHEKSLCETLERLENRISYFSEKIVQPKSVLPTITARGGEIWIGNTGSHINNEEIIFAQTFPKDYQFFNSNVRYVCGMSVPPIMIKRIILKLIEEGIYNYVK